MYKNLSFALALLVFALSWGCDSSSPAPIAPLESDAPAKQEDEGNEEAIRYQLEATVREIREAEARLRAFDIRNPGSAAVLEREVGFMLEQRVLLTLELAEAQARYHVYIQRVEEGTFEPDDAEVLELASMPLIVELESEIVAHRVALRMAEARVEAGVEEAGAEVNRLNRQIAELEMECDVAWDEAGRRLLGARLEEAHIEVLVLMEKLASLSPEILERRVQLQDVVRMYSERESIERRVFAWERRREALEARLGDMELQ